MQFKHKTQVFSTEIIIYKPIFTKHYNLFPGKYPPAKNGKRKRFIKVKEDNIINTIFAINLVQIVKYPSTKDFQV